LVVRTGIDGMTFDGATSEMAVKDASIAFVAATAQANAEAEAIR
jgi:hypothetical protein